LAERIRWTRSERAWAAGCLSIISITVLGALLLVANAVAGAPPLHEIHTAGAEPVDYQVVNYDGRISVWGPTVPTMSLDEFRCEAWRDGGQEVCPDAAELSRLLWPKLKQAPGTLYVGIRSTLCSPSLGHFNIEYSAGALLMHCYDARPWFVFPLQTPHYLYGQSVIDLVTVTVVGIPPGRLEVVFEYRVERWLFDAVDTFPLGAVNLPA
jgi:hypothetical protein